VITKMTVSMPNISTKAACLTLISSYLPAVRKTVLARHAGTYKKHCCGFSPVGSNYELEALGQCIPLSRHVLPVP